MANPAGSDRHPAESDRHPATPDRHQAAADRLSAAASTIEAFGRSNHPESYTGLTLDPDQRGLMIYRRPSSSFDTELHHLVAGLPVSVHDARYSEQEMLAVVARLGEDDAYWRERGLRIVSFGPRFDGAGIELTTPDVELAQRLLPARYDIEFQVTRGGPVTPYQTTRPGPRVPDVGATESAA